LGTRFTLYNNAKPHELQFWFWFLFKNNSKFALYLWSIYIIRLTWSKIQIVHFNNKKILRLECKQS
jgi:hypothetical protein